jgi:hypothetical protein
VTPAGHSLAGLAIGVLGMPQKASCWHTLAHLAAFAILPNVPDPPIPSWGHDRYDISHSLFSNLSLGLLVMLALAWRSEVRARLGGWPVLVSGVGAWLSHLLLDSFYSHGLGVAIFWPLFNASLALPIPWFNVVPSPPPFTPALLIEYWVELLSYLPLVLLAWLVKRLRDGRRAWSTSVQRINE